MSQIINFFKEKTIGEDYPSGITLGNAEICFIDFITNYGDLASSTLLDMVDEGTITEEKLAKLIVDKYYKQWYNLFKGCEQEYEILWNVDGTEVRTIVTEFGKKITDEQLTDSVKTTDFGKVVTQKQKSADNVTVNGGGSTISEQLVDGHNNRTDSLTDTENHIADKITKTYLNGYDQDSDSPSSRVVEDGGSDSVSHTGTSNTNISSGKTQVTETGGGSTTTTLGDRETTDSGDETITSSEGKKEEVESGTEKVTDTFERGGNIGVTKSTELLKDHMELWGSAVMNLLTYIYKDIVSEVSIPYWL